MSHIHSPIKSRHTFTGSAVSDAGEIAVSKTKCLPHGIYFLEARQ